MTTITTSIDDWLAEYGQWTTPDHEMYLLLGGCLLSVKANHPRIIEEARDYFAFFVAEPGTPDISIEVFENDSLPVKHDYTVKQPDPGKIKCKEEFLELDNGRVVRKRLTGMVFAFGGSRHVAVGPCLSNMNQVVNFINNRYIQWLLHRGHLLGHAAGVRSEKFGLAMAGFSGMGKSTLALHLMSKGSTFVSNDRLLVANENGQPVMRGVPKQPRVNPGTILSLPELEGTIDRSDVVWLRSLPPKDLWNLEQKHDIIIESVYGDGRFQLEAPFTALILLNWKHGHSGTEVKRVDLEQRRDLLPAFMKETGLFYQTDGTGPANRSEEDYLQVLSNCKVYEASGQIDFEYASRVAQRILETGDVEG